MITDINGVKPYYHENNIYLFKGLVWDKVIVPNGYRKHRYNTKQGNGHQEHIIVAGLYFRICEINAFCKTHAK